jgi:hypothetical protein
MERRNLLVGLMALVISLFLLTGTALAHKSGSTKGGQTTTGAPVCVINSVPSFVASGEFGEASSVADIVEVECSSVYAEHFVKISSQELYNQCDDHLAWISDTIGAGNIGPSIGKVQLDDDGNATVAVWGGPSCASGEALVSAHLEEAPYTTVTTAFTVKAPKVTTPGVTALVPPPSTTQSEVENDTDSTVATIVQVEFPAVYAEKTVNISAEQLFDSCQLAPHVVWFGPNLKTVSDKESVKVKLDDDGNAFVVLFGFASCAAGPSEIEASLEVAPYTTYTTVFNVLPPEETF